MREWYEIKFSLEFRSKLGTEFQDFFSSIMERRYLSDFQKVKPYGKHGDRKCDGYHGSVKRVYQVYAPEKMNVAETNTKIEEDFRNTPSGSRSRSEDSSPESPSWEQLEPGRQAAACTHSQSS